MNKDIERIWIISDIHFGVKSNSIEWINIQKEYFYDFLIPIIKENKQEKDVLFILGDIFDSRQFINVYVLNIVLEIFKDLNELLPIYIILGNHDIYKKYSNDINSLKILNFFNNIFVFENPEIINTKYGNLMLCPWIEDKNKEKEIINSYNFDYLFCHTDISNVKLNSYSLYNQGHNLDEFKNIKRIFSGHIHYQQEINNLIIVGTPYQLYKSDINNDKYLYLFDLKTNNIKKWKNNISPQFLRINFKEILEYTIEEFEEKINNNFIDILIDNYFSSIVDFSKIYEIGTNAREINFILINNDNEIFNNILENNNSDNKIKNFSIEEITYEYIKSLNYDEKLKNELILLTNKLFKNSNKMINNNLL